MKSTMNPMRRIGLGEPGLVVTRPEILEIPGVAGELSHVAPPSARTGEPVTCAPVTCVTEPGMSEPGSRKHDALGTGLFSIDLFSSSYPGFPAKLTGTCTLRPDSQRDHRWSNQPKFQAA